MIINQNKKRAMESLQQALLTDTDQEVRSFSAKALEQWGEEAIPYLCDALDRLDSKFIRL